ncbi:MAG: glycosyltransferase family 2 protein [Thermoanaerobaculia bacterium]
MISLIVPFFNEEESVSFVLKEAEEVLRNLGEEFEIIAIDDGSKDKTLENLLNLKKEIKNLRVLKAKENGGQSSAVWAGIINSKGNILITMDGDGQNVPQDIPNMLKELQNFDMVVGVRQKRKDNLWKKISSRVANSFRKIVLGDSFKDIGCGLRVFKKEITNFIPPFKTIHRFLPILVLWQGYKVKEIEIKHRERYKGKSKYGTWGRLKAGLYDLIGMLWLKKRIIKYCVEEINDK